MGAEQNNGRSLVCLFHREEVPANNKKMFYHCLLVVVCRYALYFVFFIFSVFIITFPLLSLGLASLQCARALGTKKEPPEEMTTRRMESARRKRHKGNMQI